MRLIDKALRGMELEELTEIINDCCENGKRDPGGFSESKANGFRQQDIIWGHEIMGIPLEFQFYKALEPSFRLHSKDWSISFKGSRSYMPKVSEYHEVRIGPLELLDTPPTQSNYYAHSFRRRGDLQRFRHDLTLIRLTL